MKQFILQPGPVHLLRLDTDDDLYDTVTEYVRDHRIEAAAVSFLGAVRRASLRYYDQQAKQYVDFTIDEPLEGEPFLHIHAAFSDERGGGHGGHVNSGTVVFALEVTIASLEGKAPERRPDDCTGLTLW